MCQHNLSLVHFTELAAEGGGHASDEPLKSSTCRRFVTCSKAPLNEKCFQKAVGLCHRGAALSIWHYIMAKALNTVHLISERIQTSVWSGIMGENGKRTSVQGKKEEKVQKTMHFFWRHYFAAYKAGKCHFHGENRLSVLCAASTNFPYKITSHLWSSVY